MLSKEEIGRAKERISKSLNDVLFSTLYSQEENEEDEKILLAYIKQLETKLENVFWEGYITKQNEAVEICKICKYKNKLEQLENKVKELECDNRNKENKIIEQEKFLQMASEVIKNSLLKQAIRDKIKELDKAYENSKDENGESPYFYPEHTINTLQELLEEK